MTCDEYIAKVDAVRQLLELATSIAPEEPEPRLSETSLSASQREAFYGLMESTGSMLTEAFERRRNPGVEGTGSASIKIEDPEVAATFTRFLFNAIHQVRMPSQQVLLMRSILSLITSDFELLVSKVVRAVMEAKPSIVSGANSTITLADLESLDDIRAARSMIVGRKTDELMRKSFDDWARWFGEIGVRWRDMTSDWAGLVEIFARRNVMVHAGGLASEQYRAVLREAKMPANALPRIGEKLDLNGEYLADASERLLAFGVLLVAGSWLQLVKRGDTKECQSWIVSRTSQLLERGHFVAVRAISGVVLENSRNRLSRTSALSLQTSGWVARRELNECADVEREVEAWDVDGIDLRFAHVRPVLLGDDDRAVADIGELVKRRNVTRADLLESPLYRPLLERRRADLLSLFDTAAVGGCKDQETSQAPAAAGTEESEICAGQPQTAD